ncbi:hypothetical protein PS2_032947 [Malus domestica]
MASIKKLPPILLLSEVEMTSALQDDRSPISKRHMVAIQSSGSMVADMITPLTHTIVEHRKMEPLNVDVWKMGRVGALDHMMPKDKEDGKRAWAPHDYGPNLVVAPLVPVTRGFDPRAEGRANTRRDSHARTGTLRLSLVKKLAHEMLSCLQQVIFNAQLRVGKNMGFDVILSGRTFVRAGEVRDGDRCYLWLSSTNSIYPFGKAVPLCTNSRVLLLGLESQSTDRWGWD